MLQQLLEELTLMGLADAQAERTNLPLSQSDIDAQAEEGRVRFAEGYATNNDTPEKSLERMRQAFNDGLFLQIVELADRGGQDELRDRKSVV